MCNARNCFDHGNLEIRNSQHFGGGLNPLTHRLNTALVDNVDTIWLLSSCTISEILRCSVQLASLDMRNWRAVSMR